MPARKRRAKRDVEKAYPASRFVAKLRRLADCIERGTRFRIQVGGERVLVPPTADYTSRRITYRHETPRGFSSGHEKGDTVKVDYCPGAPSIAVLVPGFSLAHYLIPALGVFAVFCLIPLWQALIIMRIRRRHYESIRAGKQA